ncbi:MAG: STAS domain-containing protein [Planctomycetota bacterium]
MATRFGAATAERDGRGRGPGLAIERGPDWLFVQVGDVGDQRAGRLADSVWEAIREHGASRVVLELDRVETVDEALGDAIAEIGTRVRDAGGLIRICGLTPSKLSRLRSVPAVGAVPHFDSRSEAVGPRRCGAGTCE